MARTAKKTWLMDQRLVDRVRRIYRAKTETEAVTKALQEVVTDEKLNRALRKMAGRLPRFEKSA